MTKRIKIAIIYPTDPSGKKVGGISTFLKNFVKFSPNNFTIKWIGISEGRGRNGLGKWKRIKVGGKEIDFMSVMDVKDENQKLSVPLGLRFVFSLLCNVARYKKCIKNHILNFHRIDVMLPFILYSNKKVLFLHGNTQDYYNPKSEIKWSKIPFIYFLMEKYIIKKFDKIYIVREDAVISYRKKYPDLAEKISFIPTWVDEDVFYPCKNGEKTIARREFFKMNKFSDDAKTILFVGRFEGQKDPILLIKTFCYIVSKLPSVRLLLIGQGSLKNEMKKLLCEEDIQDKVSFLGVLPQGDIAAIMRVSDVFLLTSAFEGMPMSVMESLGSGLPVVTTDAGEVKRVVQDGVSGRIISRRDAQVIGDGVIDVLNDEKYRNSEVVRSCVKDFFAHEILKQMYYQIEKIAISNGVNN